MSVAFSLDAVGSSDAQAVHLVMQGPHPGSVSAVTASELACAWVLDLQRATDGCYFHKV